MLRPISTSVTDFLKGIVGFLRAIIDFLGRYRSIMHSLDVTVNANTEMGEQHICYRAILIVTNLINY